VVTRQHDDLPAGWLTQFRRGVLSGAGLLLIAVAACAVPAFAVWLVPGADSTPASSAVKSGALLAFAGAHGGLRLDGDPVTLAPLLVTGLLAWLIAGQARRSESWSTVIGLAVGYGLASGVLAGWARLGATRAPALRTMLAGAVFVAVVSVLARGWERWWPRLAERQQRMLRAAGALTSCYLGAGSLLVAGSLIGHLGRAETLQRQVAAGAAGLPVALLGIAGAPNAAAAGAGYLLGPGFSVGAHTQVSAWGSSRGRLPSFPVLAALPHNGTVSALGVGAIVLMAALAGGLTVRLLRSDAPWQHRLLDQVGTAVLTGGALAVLAGLAGGDVGSGALRGVGAAWWSVGASAVLLIVLASSLGLAGQLLWARRLPVAPTQTTQPAADAGESRTTRLRAVPRSSEDDRPATGRQSAESSNRSRQVG